MLIMARLRPKKETYQPKVTDVIDITPWKYTIVAGIVIAALVISTYVIFN